MDDKDFIIAVLRILFPVGIGSIGATSLVVFALLFYPEKVDKWRGLIWGGIENLGLLYKKANKEKFDTVFRAILVSLQSSWVMIYHNLTLLVSKLSLLML